MAKSGTFTSKRYGNSNGPWLTLAWSQVSQSITNNTTTLDLTLKFHWDRNTQYTFHNRSGSVQGNSYTYSGSASGTSGSKTLKTQRITVSHNSNGSKSLTLSGNITSLGLYWREAGVTIGTMSVSGSANLETIPRASTLSKFSFNANLKNGTANKIKYTIDRKSTAFRHHIELRDGNTVVRTWDNISSGGDSTLTLKDSEVNALLNRMKNSTTKSYTLRVRTRSGDNGGWIGSAVSRNATATVHSDVKPTVSAVTLSQSGNPVSTHTLQGFSKIKASFTRSAGYGATISSSSIQVRRKSGGVDSQTINSNDGTTSNPVSLHGVYEARGTTRDSRGRNNYTAWATITVTPYSAPTITKFSAARNGSTPTTVNISRTTTHTVLGTSNHLAYTIQRRQGTGAWTNVNSGASGTVTTSGATGSATSTGNTVTSSYEFRLVVTDKLGGRAESLQSVSTQRVVLDIHKNEGVGIGKIREQGVLDVDGEAHFKGDLFVNGTNISTAQPLTDYLSRTGTSAQDTPTFWSDLPQGTYYVASNVIPNQPTTYGMITVSNLRGDFNIIWYAQASGNVYRKSGNTEVSTGWEIIDGPEYGTGSNGRWIRFRDGTQICYCTIEADLSHGNWQNFNYPNSFTLQPSLTYAPQQSEVSATRKALRESQAYGYTTSQFRFLISGNRVANLTHPIHIVAVGRWKS